HHTDGRSAHGIAGKKDLRVVADLIYHPLYPFQAVIAVHGAETNIGSLALSVGSLIDEKHTESVLQIIPGKTAVIIQTFAGVTVKADHSLRSFISFEIGSMQLQTVP